MINLQRYLLSYIFKPKRTIIDIDSDFWGDIDDTDIEEAIEEYVRDSSDFYESTY